MKFNIFEKAPKMVIPAQTNPEHFIKQSTLKHTAKQLDNGNICETYTDQNEDTIIQLIKNQDGKIIKLVDLRGTIPFIEALAKILEYSNKFLTADQISTYYQQFLDQETTTEKKYPH